MLVGVAAAAVVVQHVFLAWASVEKFACKNTHFQWNVYLMRIISWKSD